MKRMKRMKRNLLAKSDSLGTGMLVMPDHDERRCEESSLAHIVNLYEEEEEEEDKRWRKAIGDRVVWSMERNGQN